MNVLMILTSHDQMGDTGHKTGFWLDEFTAPYYVFRDAGANITLASPKGGQPPVDPNSEADDALTDTTRRFNDDSEARKVLANTHKLSTVRAEDYDAVFYPGGHGPLWDLTNDSLSVALIENAARQDKVLGAVCHGPAVFRDARNEAGEPLVSGRKVTGFTNTEEEAVQLTGVVPFLVEDMLKSKGAKYSRGDDWASYVVTDGKLITGQNPTSSEAVAEAVLEVLRTTTSNSR